LRSILLAATLVFLGWAYREHPGAGTFVSACFALAVGTIVLLWCVSRWGSRGRLRARRRELEELIDRELTLRA
jgi:hypothetical protein